MKKLKKKRLKRIKTVKSSTRPSNIKKESHHVPAIDKPLKLKEGPNAPNAGPTCPKLEAATPIEETKSSPVMENPKEPMIKDNIYKIKNPEILYIIL